eukprot:TRINITY_DN30781_c0_g1_i1.p1 TRINITY_DN30781_c0_g1~~TRINITY_DN30781_c0_g1_i1.p1  ORF type:complete len:195 (+),score=20.20 TRINITY_DN30781_c0_g1_i1:89-586(+)
MTLSVIICAIYAAYEKGNAISYNYGESACIFATNASCAPSYQSIFYGEDSVSTLFKAFGPIVGSQLLFSFLRTALSVCYDFKFMAISSSVTFVLVYLPLLFFVRFYHTSIPTLLYFLIMYLPHFVLTIIFAFRLWYNIRRLFAEEPGPWTPAQRTEATEETSLVN